MFYVCILYHVVLLLDLVETCLNFRVGVGLGLGLEVTTDQTRYKEEKEEEEEEQGMEY